MKRILGALFSVMLALAMMPARALAEHLSGQDGWTVTFTSAGKMEDNYSSDEYVDKVAELQPGDDITFTITVKHENDTACDWYMKNDVIKTLEENAQYEAAGSAYGYRLTYQGPEQDERVLFDSDVVGGDQSDKSGDQANAGEGLETATDGIDEYVMLQTLSKGQEGTLKLVVTLDGETEGNAYFNTLARLKFGFAVEMNPSKDTPEEEDKPTTSTTTSTNKGGGSSTKLTELVKTGDEERLLPFYIAMVVSGVLLLILAIVSVRERKKEQEEALR